MRIAIAIMVVMAGAVAPLTAQEKLTENTLRLSADAKTTPGNLADMSWIEGRWIGEGLGGRLEEVWTAPEGGAMMGMFRLIRDGKPSFYELLSIAEFDGRMAMRLRHANPDMTGWEEKKDFVEFRWIGVIDGVHHFSGLAFRREGNDAMTIFLALKGKEGTKEHVLKMRRADQATTAAPPPTATPASGRSR
jgi:hypothetical protein